LNINEKQAPYLPVLLLIINIIHTVVYKKKEWWTCVASKIRIKI